MIVVKLIWGLGNQLSQYAMGRHIAMKNNTNLLIDISSFDTYTLHKYSLNHFRIQENFTSKSDTPWYEIRSKNQYFDFILNKMKPLFRSRQHILEKGLAFQNEYLQTQWDYIYLEGYWQTEKYFIEIEDIIRDEFQFKTLPSKQNQIIIDEISLQPNTVSLHIRRGDYVTSAVSHGVHGTCDMDYYMRAVAYIAERYPGSKFYVFSDDIPWAKENMILPYQTCYIDHNDALSNYEDMRLMSLCTHNIIANSTFSWWGAWLNKNPEKIVIAPKQWFNDPKHLAESQDVVPEKWIRL